MKTLMSHKSFPDWANPLNRTGFLFWLLCYLFAHLALRLLLSDTLQLDDSEQLIHSQALEMAYGNFQPPLYTWVVWGLWQLIDPSMWALYLLRYLLIGLSFYLWYRVSERLFSDPYWRLAAASSWLLLSEMAWKLHQASTHSTLLTLALIGSLYAVIRLIDKQSWQHYLLLGLSIGVGLMAKYSYAGFLLPLLLAGLITPQTRQLILDKRLLITLSVALCIAGPNLWFFLNNPVGMETRLQAEVSHSTGGLLSGDLSLLLQFGKAALGFLLPLLLVYALVVRRTPKPDSSLSADGTVQTLTTLLNRFHLFVGLILLAIAAFTSTEHMKVRWLHPFLLITPFWLLLLAQQLNWHLHWRRLAAITLSLIVLVFAARLIQLVVTPHYGKPSRVTWPVTAALQNLPQGLLQQPGLQIPDTFLAAHQRLRDPSPINVSDKVSQGTLLMWGGTQQQIPAWAAPHVGEQTKPQWASAQRGNITYWIGYLQTP